MIEAFKTCFTSTLNYYSSNGDIDNIEETNLWWKHAPRVIAQTFLGIGKWEGTERSGNNYVYLQISNSGELSNAPELRDRNGYSNSERIMALAILILFLPLTVLALTIKLADAIFCYDTWAQLKQNKETEHLLP